MKRRLLAVLVAGASLGATTALGLGPLLNQLQNTVPRVQMADGTCYGVYVWPVTTDPNNPMTVCP